jgi:hypothetical protein
MLGGIVAPALVLRLLADGMMSDGRLQLTIASLFLFGAPGAGELLERYLFFAAVAAPRMPGGIR